MQLQFFLSHLLCVFCGVLLLIVVDLRAAMPILIYFVAVSLQNLTSHFIISSSLPHLIEYCCGLLRLNYWSQQISFPNHEWNAGGKNSGTLSMDQKYNRSLCSWWKWRSNPIGILKTTMLTYKCADNFSVFQGAASELSVDNFSHVTCASSCLYVFTIIGIVQSIKTGGKICRKEFCWLTGVSLIHTQSQFCVMWEFILQSRILRKWWIKHHHQSKYFGPQFDAVVWTPQHSQNR